MERTAGRKRKNKKKKKTKKEQGILFMYGTVGSPGQSSSDVKNGAREKQDERQPRKEGDRGRWRAASREE